MSKPGFVIFLTVAIAVYAGMHLFIFWRIAAGLGLAPGQRLGLKLVLLAGALSFVAGEFLSRQAGFRGLLCAGSIWLGIVSIALAAFAAESLLSLAFSRQRRPIVLAALAAVALVSAWSLLNAALAPARRELRVPVRGLAAGGSGFTIVHLSDLHLGNLTSMRRLRRIVAEVNAMRPDLVCVTGDTLDGEVGRDGKYCAVLGGLRARLGVVAVTGNHEFYAGVDKFIELARCSRWRLLRNESWIADGRLAVVGLDDDTAGRAGQPGPDLERALRGVPPGMPTVLLYHQPLRFAAAARRGIDLQLSGHTHAGQIPPMDLLVYLTYRYPSGLYRLGEAHIHTSPGSSTWGPPMRFLSRSQIVKLVLFAAGKPDGGNRATEGE